MNESEPRRIFKINLDSGDGQKLQNQIKNAGQNARLSSFHKMFLLFGPCTHNFPRQDEPNLRIQNTVFSRVNFFGVLLKVEDLGYKRKKIIPG